MILGSRAGGATLRFTVEFDTENGYRTGTDQNLVIHLYTDDQARPEARSRGDACVALGVGRAGQP